MVEKVFRTAKQSTGTLTIQWNEKKTKLPQFLGRGDCDESEENLSFLNIYEVARARRDEQNNPISHGSSVG